jgi:hypothetical protein
VAQKVYTKKCNLQARQLSPCFLQREKHIDTTLMGQVKIRREAQKKKQAKRVVLAGRKKKKSCESLWFFEMVWKSNAQMRRGGCDLLVVR